jgi:hypothetical protein
MLGLFAECMLIASRTPPTDRNARLREQLRREDEDYLASRRSHFGEARR